MELIDISAPSTNYKVRQVYEGAWYVEFIWDAPAETNVYRTIFIGQEAKNRAEEYAGWKNRS